MKQRAWPFTAVAVAAAVIICSHLPFLVMYFRNLWRGKPHYEFFPVVLAAVAWLFWSRWPRGAIQHTSWSRILGWALLIGGLLFLSGAVILYSPWLAAVAATLCIGGCMFGMCGSRDIEGYLWLAGHRLRRGAKKVRSAARRLIGAPITSNALSRFRVLRRTVFRFCKIWLKSRPFRPPAIGVPVVFLGAALMLVLGTEHLLFAASSQAYATTAHMALGDLHVARRDAENAIAHFEVASRKRPELFLILAQLYRAVGDSQQAAVAAQQSVDYYRHRWTANPDQWDLGIRLALSQMQLRRYPQAISVLTNLQRTAPADEMERALAVDGYARVAGRLCRDSLPGYRFFAFRSAEAAICGGGARRHGMRCHE